MSEILLRRSRVNTIQWRSEGVTFRRKSRSCRRPLLTITQSWTRFVQLPDHLLTAYRFVFLKSEMSPKID